MQTQNIEGLVQRNTDSTYIVNLIANETAGKCIFSKFNNYSSFNFLALWFKLLLSCYFLQYGKYCIVASSHFQNLVNNLLIK